MNPENATEQILYAILKTVCSLYVLLFDEILYFKHIPMYSFYPTYDSIEKKITYNYTSRVGSYVKKR